MKITAEAGPDKATAGFDGPHLTVTLTERLLAGNLSQDLLQEGWYPCPGAQLELFDDTKEWRFYWNQPKRKTPASYRRQALDTVLNDVLKQLSQLHPLSKAA